MNCLLNIILPSSIADISYYLLSNPEFHSDFFQRLNRHSFDVDSKHKRAAEVIHVYTVVIDVMS